MTSKEYEEAHVRFLNNNPTLKNSIGVLSPKEQQKLIEQAFEDEAERLGVGDWELTLLLNASSKKLADRRILEVHKEIAEMANISWPSYCRLHNLAPCSDDCIPPVPLQESRSK